MLTTIHTTLLIVFKFFIHYFSLGSNRSLKFFLLYIVFLNFSYFTLYCLIIDPTYQFDGKT
jgi:hypothetical protein